MLIEIIVPVVCILAIAIIFMISKLHELYKERQLKKLVSWIFVNSPLSASGHDFPLEDYIFNAQYKFEIKKEFCISKELELDFVKEILEEFKKDMFQSYFADNLKTVKSKYVISGEHYFMSSLQRFLQKHQCDHHFLNYDMHKETIAYKEYGSWGGKLFDATYALTDFAITYHKMLYIAHTFCKNCKPLAESNLSLLFDDEKDLEKILNTKQIKISRF